MVASCYCSIRVHSDREEHMSTNSEGKRGDQPNNPVVFSQGDNIERSRQGLQVSEKYTPNGLCITKSDPVPMNNTRGVVSDD